MVLKNNIAIITQIAFTILFMVHRFIKPLGSDLMFGILIPSLIMSIYLFWQIFKIKSFVGIQKTVAIICAWLPFIWLLLFLNFIF